MKIVQKVSLDQSDTHAKEIQPTEACVGNMGYVMMESTGMENDSVKTLSLNHHSIVSQLQENLSWRRRKILQCCSLSFYELFSCHFWFCFCITKCPSSKDSLSV